MRKVAVINDLSGFGKCSLTAAIPVLSALGVQCCPLPTAVLTGQTEYPVYYSSDLSDMFPKYIDAWQKNDVHLDAIYTGFLTGSQQIAYVMDFLKVFHQNETLLLVDPIMGDDAQTYDIFSAELLSGMKELTQMAQLITPNLTEACLLTDSDIGKMETYSKESDLLKFAEETAEKLQERALTEQEIIITGIKCRNSSSPAIFNLVSGTDKTFFHKSHFIDKNFSGTGDLFASVVCGCKVRGQSTAEAVELAGSFLYHSISDTIKEKTSANDGVNFEKFLSELILF